MSVVRQVQHQEPGHHRIIHIGESVGEAWHQQRLAHQGHPWRVRRRPIILGNQRQHGKSHAGRDHLHGSGAAERTQPRAHHRPHRDAAPDPAAQVPQRLPAAFDAGQFHRPCRRAGIKARLAKTLQNAPSIGSRQAERQQIRNPRQRATAQPAQKCEFAPAPVRQRSGNQPARQSHEREYPDHQTDRLVRCTQVMTHVRTDQRQHRAHPKKSEKRGADQRPEAPPKGAHGRPHRLFDCSVYREDAKVGTA